jgi:hypothetical protein
MVRIEIENGVITWVAPDDICQALNRVPIGLTHRHTLYVMPSEGRASQ